MTLVKKFIKIEVEYIRKGAISMKWIHWIERYLSSGSWAASARDEAEDERGKQVNSVLDQLHSSASFCVLTVLVSLAWLCLAREYDTPSIVRNALDAIGLAWIGGAVFAEAVATVSALRYLTLSLGIVAIICMWQLFLQSGNSPDRGNAFDCLRIIRTVLIAHLCAVLYVLARLFVSAFGVIFELGEATAENQRMHQIMFWVVIGIAFLAVVVFFVYRKLICAVRCVKDALSSGSLAGDISAVVPLVCVPVGLLTLVWQCFHKPILFCVLCSTAMIALGVHLWNCRTEFDSLRAS